MSQEGARAMNNLVKIYSHYRSGTNMLCGMLYINFWPGHNLSTPDGNDGAYFITHTGERTFYNPWGQLFGSHKLNCEYNPKRSIYIYRNINDVVLSMYNRLDKRRALGLENSNMRQFRTATLWRVHRRNVTLSEYVKYHQETWLARGVYAVRFEDVLDHPTEAVIKIGNKFGLKPVGNEIRLLPHRVGWFSE